MTGRDVQFELATLRADVDLLRKEVTQLRRDQEEMARITRGALETIVRHVGLAGSRIQMPL